MGISLSDFIEEKVEQISIFDTESLIEIKNVKEEKIKKAFDNIRKKYGMDKIKRAKTI